MDSRCFVCCKEKEKDIDYPIFYSPKLGIYVEQFTENYNNEYYPICHKCLIPFLNWRVSGETRKCNLCNSFSERTFKIYDYIIDIKAGSLLNGSN